MNSARKQRWQQATALVSLSAAGAVTGIAFTHGAPGEMTSPTGMPARLLADSQASRPASAGDSALRSAIVSAARYYLRLAQSRSPAQMEALIWDGASVDGVDHGESCAAFASLTLQAGAQASGQASWVTGGASYPWPLHEWADARVDPNPESPGIISILQDAEAHHRWHALGDGYTPQPGDWVMFDGHVEVVTRYTGGVLYTIGGDSMPNLSVNSHQYDDPLAAQGVEGFVNNGALAGDGHPAPAAVAASVSSTSARQAAGGDADIPGLVGQAGDGIVGEPAAWRAAGSTAAGSTAAGSTAPGSTAARSTAADGNYGQPALLGGAAIPGMQPTSGTGAGGSAANRYGRSEPAPGPAPALETAAKQAFIQEVAPGAVAAQRQYGVPAAVTIAQAIDESGWGQSQLATQDNNLFGIKGSGPAGSVQLPTQEFVGGQWVTVDAPFRVYNSVAESIVDHSLLLATGSSYKQAMADRADPDAFANHLTGVYATDPSYGANLITIMRLYNLYRYSTATHAAPRSAAHAGAQAGPVPGSAANAAAATAEQAFQGVSADAAAIPGAGGTGHGTAQAGGSGRGASDAGRARRTAHRHRTADRPVPGSARAVASPPAVASQPAVVSPAPVASPLPVVSPAPMVSPPALISPPAATSPPAVTSSPAVAYPRAVTSPPAMTAPAVASRAPAASPGPAASGSGSAGSPAGATIAEGQARIPGVPGASSRAASAHRDRPLRAGPRSPRISTRRYVAQMPRAVTTAFIATAKTPLLRSEPMYRDVASDTGVGWQLLAACDWMQCMARRRVSPVYGEKLGTKNADGTVYRTKSQAVAQCAYDLIDLAAAVYGIDLTQRLYLSVRDLASAFAAFRWGGLLAAHHISAMEFPYSVEGLTAQHMKMRWPDVPDTPRSDKAGSRFPMAFGAVPIVLALDYPAVA